MIRVSLALLASVLLVGLCGCGASEPTDAAAIHAAARAAMGGGEAVDGVQRIRALARAVSSAGTYSVATFSDGEKLRFVQTRQDAPSFRAWIDGDGAWVEDAVTQEVSPMSAQQVEIVRGHEFQLIALRFGERFPYLQYAGEERFLGSNCALLQGRRPDGGEVKAWFHRDTGLLAGYQLPNPGDPQRVGVTMRFLDWRAVRDVTVPTKVLASDVGGEFLLHYSTLDINPEPSAEFEPPPGLAAAADSAAG